MNGIRSYQRRFAKRVVDLFTELEELNELTILRCLTPESALV
jgi:hypothetical protein